MSTESSFTQVDRRESFHSSIWSNPREELASFQSQDEFYDRLSIITQVAFTCITFLALASSVIFAPYIVPVVLFCSYIFLRNILVPLCEKRIEVKENMKIAEGIVNKIIEIEKKCTSYWDYKNYFTEKRIETAFIDHKGALTAIDPTRICYKALINPLARVSYWSDRSLEIAGELNLLQKKKEDEATVYSNEKNRTKRKKLFQSIKKTDKKIQKLTEEEYLPAKCKAAFNLHLLANPGDLRRFEEFGQLSLMSYQDSFNLRSSHAEQPYFYFNKKAELPLTKDWLMNATIPQIAKKIYRDLAIIT